MSKPNSEVSPEVLNRDNAEALAQRLKEFPKPLRAEEQVILDLFVHMLTDPIERLKLGPAGRFSEEEEAILQSLERSAKGMPLVNSY